MACFVVCLILSVLSGLLYIIFLEISSYKRGRLLSSLGLIHLSSSEDINNRKPFKGFRSPCAITIKKYKENKDFNFSSQIEKIGKKQRCLSWGGITYEKNSGFYKIVLSFLTGIYSGV